MDMRTQGKDFDRYLENAKKSGVRFERARVHSVAQPQHGDDLTLRYARKSGAIEEEAFDIVVLSTGLEIAPEAVALAEKLGVPLNADHFAATDSFAPVATGKPGIYACGAFTGPKDIPHSVMEASAAAAAATESLSASRPTRTRTVALPPETEVRGQAPRIGVFVCNCGINIGGVVRVPEVAEFARTLPHVTYVEENLFICSQDTQDKMELDDLIAADDPRLAGASDVVFIQCVGSRNAERPYCSKVCCTHALRNALAIKAARPETQIYVLYRDMRTYGLREEIFREARAKGVLFFQYDPEAAPEVERCGERVQVTFRDHVLDRRVAVEADLLALAAAIVPNGDNSLAQFFKVPVDGDGWLLEAHQKLRPVDFATDGVFLCGLAHYPKPIDESVSQALAAAARAATFLARETILVGGVVSWIDPALCTGCGGCIQVCPYNAIAMSEITGMAEVNPALCKGCGACAAACPSEAPILMGFNNRQLYAQIHSALAA